jgi:hypothetical protein
MKESLSDFFCNNFYENILSPNYIEYNLLFLISLMLKEEITNISEINTDEPQKYLNLFLNNSSCSFILEQFTKKKDVQTYFKTILIDIIQDLELSSGNKEMQLDLTKIEQEIMIKNRSRKISADYLKSSRGMNEKAFGIISNNFDNEFMKKNIFPMNSNYFEKLTIKNKENETMVGYLVYHMDEIEKEKNIYISESFSKFNLNDTIYQQILNEYENNYNKAKDIIKNLFENIKKYLYLLPYSIKCICKIIGDALHTAHCDAESCLLFLSLLRAEVGNQTVSCIRISCVGCCCPSESVVCGVALALIALAVAVDISVRKHCPCIIIMVLGFVEGIDHPGALCDHCSKTGIEQRICACLCNDCLRCSDFKDLA